VIGENGVGKSTFLKLLMGELRRSSAASSGRRRRGFGYYAQDHAEDFKSDTSLTDWVAEFARANAAEGEDLETLIRGTLGRLLFSGDEVKKAVKVISGGEQGRMIFGKLMLMKPNVLVMDEPTNHLDMESIESLNTALEKFKGTLVFVSHDREFVSSLATRILEIRMDGSIVNYLGNYEEYLVQPGHRRLGVEREAARRRHRARACRPRCGAPRCWPGWACRRWPFRVALDRTPTKATDLRRGDLPGRTEATLRVGSPVSRLLDRWLAAQGHARQLGAGGGGQSVVVALRRGRQPRRPFGTARIARRSAACRCCDAVNRPEDGRQPAGPNPALLCAGLSAGRGTCASAPPSARTQC
jgi:ABC-type Mn2+/Zn2+ transport system ATPase subunit